eukprot:TRINITY_DN6646_c0_g1_i1.p1 TRINITY_DN6646_c0_g1~~TRINITY_DN6646_c0_g1_i1.p1  ORF type:complete len:361 (+),score=70.40 TRINITY_DN6646_c0_g1_i1:51-1133(+)
MDYLNEHQLIQIRALIGVSSVLSVAGSAFILGTYFAYPRVRSFPVKLLAMLSISDLFGSVFHFAAVLMYNDYGHLPSTLLCQIQGGGIQLFSIAAFCWSLSISVTAYLVVAKRMLEFEPYEKYYHVSCWGFSFATIIPLIVEYHDMGPNWCWIGFEGNDIRFALSFGPAIALLLATVVFYVLTMTKILRMSRDAEIESRKYVPQMQASINAKAQTYRNIGARVSSRLSLYVAVFFVCWIWSLVNRIYAAIYNAEPPYFLFAMQAWFSPLQGLFNAIIYGNNKQVRKAYRESFRAWKAQKTQPKAPQRTRPELYVYLTDSDDDDDETDDIRGIGKRQDEQSAKNDIGNVHEYHTIIMPHER